MKYFLTLVLLCAATVFPAVAQELDPETLRQFEKEARNMRLAYDALTADGIRNDGGGTMSQRLVYMPSGTFDLYVLQASIVVASREGAALEDHERICTAILARAADRDPSYAAPVVHAAFASTLGGKRETLEFGSSKFNVQPIATGYECWTFHDPGEP